MNRGRRGVRCDAAGPGLLCGFRRRSFAVGFSDLGKRLRCTAFRPIRPAKPPRSCKQGSLVLRVAYLNVCFGSVGAGYRHCECDSASVGLDELWLVSQPARCYRVSAILFRDILSDIIWPKSGQNVKMSRKNVTKTQVRPHGREVGELCQGWRGDEPRV